MQYNFLGFSVSKMMELNLDMKDVAILRYFVDFKETGRMNYELVDDKKYYWINYNTLEKEMPYLGLGKRAIMLRMLKLRDLGILVHYTKKEGGTYSFYNLGPKYNELIEINKEENEEAVEVNIKETRVKNKELTEIKNCKDIRQANDMKSNSVQENEQYFQEIPMYEQSYAQGVQEKEGRLCINMLKGCASKGRTKTLLLNNYSTKVINIKKYIKKEVEEIVNYLNEKLKTNYKSNFKGTLRLIKARLTEGFKVEDFKIVIDKKIREWIGTEYEKYLTPTTLFGDKFEKYLNQKVVSQKSKYKNSYEAPKLRFNNFTGREYDYEELEKKLLGW